MIIDINVNLSRWPFRRLPCDETPALVAKLRENGITQAWAGSFDGLLHKNIGAVNRRLADECRAHGDGLLLPFGSINPKLPDWEEDVRRCHEEYRMRGIRLNPNYHGYQLDDPAFARLLALAAERQMIVQMALIMEDSRTLHPLMQVPPVNTAPLAALVKSLPKLRVVLLNSFTALRGEPMLRLAATGQVSFEISMLEGIGGLKTITQQMPVKHLLFGSHAPFYYVEAARLKIQESALSEAQTAAILHENATRLLTF